MQNKVQTIDKRDRRARLRIASAPALAREPARVPARGNVFIFASAPAARAGRPSQPNESLESARYLPALPGVPILELADEQYPEEEGFEGDVKSPPGQPSPPGPG